ncbi:TerB family tellurite resistance protein [Muriicola sp. Z0-33]|uniref:tellurite resistance TerB family protein n=1 Tax=Muriicola sp. Z0-33 TaxID=2816957 RepID=UPI002237840F|nr:TerB family tellurite resistance protein [Muriicola sp. Z0-33]MCW5517802.1 TerB family tellurite resistance protein [Muriicola sp. Z0-33]
MSVNDLYSSDSANNNLAHFASIASLAAVDGVIDDDEMKLLVRFADRLQITKEQFKEVMKKENKYSIRPQVSFKKRLERFYDLLRIVFTDGHIEDAEELLLTKYAIGLGFSVDKAEEILKRSIAIFTGKIDFEDYSSLIKK